jgi:pimeloyl-ACP methyl ester carboxylesterase
VVLLQHFMGNLDNYDPAITNELATNREVILTDNAGVGLSTGTAPETVAGMAQDAASLIDALGLEHVDLFGFSMGGFVAQQIAVDRPELVRRIVLVGTGPRGGEGMGGLDPEVAPLFGTAYNPQDLMWLPIFFSPSGRSQAAGRQFLERIRARTDDRDAPVSEATIAAHLAAAHEWGAAAPGSYDYLKRICHPTLVINGNNDIVVATVNSYILQQNLPNAELIIFPDSNHGSHFQFTAPFNRYVSDFLGR